MPDILDRRLLDILANGNPRTREGLERLVQQIATVSDTQTLNIAATAAIEDATVVTLSPNESFGNERVLATGKGLELADANGNVVVQFSDGALSSAAGFNIQFVPIGETVLSLPLSGTLATLADIAAVGGAGSVAALDGRLDVVEGRTGWAVYNHSTTQSLAAGTRTKLIIDAATKVETQLPVDRGPLWDATTNTIVGVVGDALLIKIQCIFTPDDAAASSCDFDVDIGGALGVVEYHSFAVTKGSGVGHNLSWSFPAYTLATWAANGGSIYAKADGAGVISNLRVVITRTHKAR